MSFKTKEINKGKNINSQQSDADFLAATDSVKTPIIYILRRKGQKKMEKISSLGQTPTFKGLSTRLRKTVVAF